MSVAQAKASPVACQWTSHERSATHVHSTPTETMSRTDAVGASVGAGRGTAVGAGWGRKDGNGDGAYDGRGDGAADGAAVVGVSEGAGDGA